MHVSGSHGEPQWQENLEWETNVCKQAVILPINKATFFIFNMKYLYILCLYLLSVRWIDLTLLQSVLLCFAWWYRAISLLSQTPSWLALTL